MYKSKANSIYSQNTETLEQHTVNQKPSDTQILSNLLLYSHFLLTKMLLEIIITRKMTKRYPGAFLASLGLLEKSSTASASATKFSVVGVERASDEIVFTLEALDFSLEHCP